MAANSTDQRTVIIDSPAVSLWFHRDSKIVHHQIRQYLHGQPFRDLLEKGAEVLEKNGANKWLSDDRGNGPLTDEDGAWALAVWGPRVGAAGWKFWAVVMPEKIFGQMNMTRWIKTYKDKGITAMAFSDPGEALTWLIEQA